MNILGYIIYGVGALVIVAFLWSSIRKQAAQTQTTVDLDDRVEPQPDTIQPDATPYDNGPECETIQSEPSVELDAAQPIIQASFTPDPSVASPETDASSPEINFTPEPQTHEEPVEENISDTLPPNIIAIHATAPRGQAFYGSDILDAFSRHGLVFNEHGIYNGMGPNHEKIYAVASSVEPGTFDLNFMDRYTTPGITFFMDLDNVSEPKVAFKSMLSTAYEITKNLGGDLLDHRRQRLTEASVVEYLAQIKGIESVRSVMSSSSAQLS